MRWFNLISPSEPAKELERSPGRAGFKRPPLTRVGKSRNLAQWIPGCPETESDHEDEEWLQSFSPSSTRSCSASSQSSDSSEESCSDDESDSAPISVSKPSVPTRTVALPVPQPVLNYDSQQEPLFRVKLITEEDPLDPTIFHEHGLSYSALLYTRDFWSARYSAWVREKARRDAEAAAASAYDGIQDTPRTRTGPLLLTSRRASRLPNDTARPPASPSALNPNAAIYPRTGDLFRLRDAHFAKMDRAFCNVPLYSIAKILYLHDMLHRATASDSKVVVHDEPPLDDASTDLSYSDDETLVADDAPQSCAPKASDLREPREWEVNWYARWRVLIDKAKDKDCGGMAVDESLLALHLEEMDRERERAEEYARPMSPKFFFGEDDEDVWGLDEDDDYGTVLAPGRSSFGISAESLSEEFLSEF